MTLVKNRGVLPLPTTTATTSTAAMANMRGGLNNRQSSLLNQNMQVESMEAGVYDVDEDIMDLHSSVLRLKNVSKAIREEASITGKILETLESSMDMAKVTLKQTMKRLDRVSKKTRGNHVLYVVLFGVVIFFCVFFWLKVRNLLRFVGIL
ncbi:MAG: SNARE domain-containing protein [bacterium]